MRKLLFILMLVPIMGISQTRLYFSNTESPAVTPPVPWSAAWSYTSESTSWKLNDVKGSSATAFGLIIGPTGNVYAIDRQYVSTRMASGITFTSGSTGVKAQLIVREFANTDNIQIFQVVARVISEDGSTVRANIYANAYNQATEAPNNTTGRNFQNTGTATASYTTVSGDRLLVEIGYLDNAGTTPEASGKFGETGTDLPENQTSTTGCGWVQFSNSITFIGEPVSATKKLGALGVGAIDFDHTIKDEPFFYLPDNYSPALLPRRRKKNTA